VRHPIVCMNRQADVPSIATVYSDSTFHYPKPATCCGKFLFPLVFLCWCLMMALWKSQNM